MSEDTLRVDGTGARRVGERWATAIVVLLVLYYVARLVFLAVNISPQIPPDETTHVGIIELFSREAFLIDDTPESHPLGLVTRVPRLYYLLMGKLLALNVFGADNFLFLRFCNIVLSLLTLLVAYRLAVRLIEDRLARLLFLVLVTNTLMFTFLGASVSYDNLVILLSVLAFHSLIGFLQTDNAFRLSAMVLCCLLGALTKLAFAPLIPILGAIVLVDRNRRLGSDLRALREAARERPRLASVTGFAMLVALIGCILLYGGNLARYGRLVPSCDRVLGVETCMENRIFARNWIVFQFRRGETTFDEALRATARIRHPGDRDHAIRLLQNEVAFRRDQPTPLPRYDYLHLVWREAMRPTIFGIQAHLSMLKEPASLWPYSLVLLAASLMFVRGSRWGGRERIWIYLAAIALLYFLFLVGYYNYRLYLASHAPFLGVQGRYVFPVLVPAYLVAARFLLDRWPWPVRLGVLVVVSSIFIAGDLPYFLRHASEAWFTAGPNP